MGTPHFQTWTLAGLIVSSVLTFWVLLDAESLTAPFEHEPLESLSVPVQAAVDSRHLRGYGFEALDDAHFSPPTHRPLRIGAFSRISVLHESGGMQQASWHRYVAGTRDFGWNITLFTTVTDDPEHAAEDYYQDGIHAHFVAGTRPGISDRVYGEGALKKVLQLHEEYPFDILLMDSLPLRDSVIAELRTIAPIGSTFHGVGITRVLEDWGAAFISGRKARRQVPLLGKNVASTSKHAVTSAREAVQFGRLLDFVVGLTPLATREFNKNYKIRREKLFTISNDFGASQFPKATADSRQQARTALNLPQDAFIVSFSGKLAEHKGLYELPEASPELLKLSNKLHIIVADPGNGEEECRELASLYSRFHCLGALDHDRLSSFYHAADTAIEPALHFLGLNTIVLESICSGVPVISADAAWTTEIFGFGDAAPLYFNLGDAHDMVRAVNETVQMSDEDRQAWADHAYRRWCPGFALHAEAEQYNEMLWWQVHQRKQQILSPSR